MFKLEKRQIIILTIMAIVVLYGVYEIFFASPARKSAAKNSPAETSSTISSLSSELLKDAAKGTDTYIISRAEEDWNKDPFLDRISYREIMAKEAGAAGANAANKIIYSGFVDSGLTRIAIINGAEYRAGDNLEMEGYYLKSISPSRVRIGNRNTGSEVEILIQE